MKFLIHISLFVIASSQLCLASDDFTKDKRYPIYNILVTEIKDYTVNDLLNEGRIHKASWPAYEDSITSAEKTENYEELRNIMEEYIAAVENLEKDKYNCDLQMKTFDKHVELYETKDSKNWMKFPKYVDLMTKKAEEDKKIVFDILNKLYVQLPVAIESFTQSLNPKEIEEYKEFLNICNLFLKENDKVVKHGNFVKLMETFMDVYTQDHCLMKAFVDFVLQVYIYLEKK